MKSILLSLIVLISGITFYTLRYENQDKLMKPTDTIIKYDMEDGSQRDLKKEWLEKIHQAEPEVNWKNIEHKNATKRYNALKNQQIVKGGEEVFADGALVGEWFEIGSKDQAGSVFATAYDAWLDELFLISAGGILFKGDSRGSQWQSQNDFIRLDVRFLNSIIEDDSITLISSVRGMPHYSRDKGLTWKKAEGINGKSEINIDSWAATEENKETFILRKPGYWDNYKLFVSVDNGRTYQEKMQFGTSDLNNLTICNPHHTEEVYVMEQIAANESRVFQWNRLTQEFDLIHANSNLAWGANGRANLVGTVDNGELVMYSYTRDLGLWKTTDTGSTWNRVAQLPSYPWRVGLYLSKENPAHMFTGEVDGFRSHDAGASWERINNWWEYYSNVRYKLHADIMYFSEYRDFSDRPFMLISNHGGISKTYDGGITNENISLDGLNVSQYYDVRTSPNDETLVLAGSQDQGFQRGYIEDDQAPNNLEQVISGDYGHITFTNFGRSMWMVYPGGNITFYNDVLGGISADYVLESSDESVWIPPIVPLPDPFQSKVYLAGGNANGGAGSYIIELTGKVIGGIEVRQLDYNFLQSNRGTVSAIEFNKFDYDIMYVASSGGGFWVSKDAGESFDRKSLTVPGSHYLYGSDIMASKLDPETIYISGSGYSTAPVIVSFDGGESFQPLGTGMPSTLAFELTTNADESLIFAATEAGPYVYIKELNEWFHLGGMTAPTQTYWSVEYLPESNRVRFGTYGRGIWDFAISEMVNSTDLAEIDSEISVYPNPVEAQLNYKSELFNSNNARIAIYDVNGKQVQITKANAAGNIDLSTLRSGVYFLRFDSEGKSVVKKVIKR